MQREDLLSGSQELLEKLFRNSPAAIGLVRLRDGVMLDINDAYERMFGWRREEVIGRSTEALGVWADLRDRARFRELILAKGRVADFESKARRKSGETFDSLLSSEAIEQEGERIALVIVVDVSGRKRAEAALRQSEHRYRTLAATMVEGILILQDGRFAYANPGALELLGYALEELVGREFVPFIHPEFRELVRERHRRRTAGEALAPRYDIRILTRSGEPRWVQIANERVDWEGRPAVLTVISDITERKAAEQALRASEERFSRMFREAPEAMTLVRAGDGTFLDVNRAWEERTGYARQDVIGRTSLDVGIWQLPQEREAKLRALRDTGSVSDLEFDMRRREGTLRRTLLNGATVEIAGEPCWLFVLRDITERRRAEEMRARLAAVVETSSDAIILSDADTRIVSWNAAAQRMFGWSAAEAVGQPVALIVPVERRHETQQNTERLVRGEIPPAFETVRMAKDGRLLDVQIGLSGVYDADGRLQVVAGIFRDITERKRAEQALRESEQRFRVLTELSADFYWEQDEECRFVRRVGQLWEQRAYPAAEVIGKTRWELPSLNMRPQDWERHRADLAARREFRNLEVERPLPGGGTRWISTAGRPIFDAQGRFRGYRGVGSDITERKVAELALRESEQRFRALVDLSSDWYWVTDAEHRFTYREGEILRRMGIPPEADYGKRRWEMGFLNMTAADWAAHRALLERREEFRDLLLERRSPDGRVNWATISGRPLYDAAGKFLGYHGTGRDVTQQVAAEERLRRFNVELERKVLERTAELDTAVKELEAFTYTVSHDLRAPLRAIEGFSRMLEERHAGALAPEGREQLQRVRAAARRMGQLIEDLIAFSRIGRGALHRRAVDLSALAHVVAKELEAGAPERRVEWRIAEGLGAHADPGLARVVLENLLGNAWKYSAKTPSAVVEFARTAAGEFVVRDNGAGFDPARSEGLFQPFRRLHAPEEFEGTGIGLATVKRVVERHGGRVRGEGAVGAGAAFYFTLPDAAEAPAPRSPD
jgi:PAS domain S-box-containing protein